MRRVILASAVALAVPAFSASPVLAPAALAAPAATSTETFVTTVAISDMFEVEAGRLATSKAANAKVKSFGQMMVDDHSKTTNDLKALIDDKKVEAKLPTSLDQDHQAKLDQLKDLSGEAFDRAYIPTQVTGHEQAVELFQNYADKGENADLKQWAQKTLPTLKGHLDQAKTLSSEIKVSDNDTDQPAGRNEQKQVGVIVDTEKGAEVRVETKQRKDRAASFDYVPRQKPTDWTAQALIGRTVENDKGDNLGDINNVILNERGQVVAVTIGVGGFLGMGEKNVGVPFEALDFRLDTDRPGIDKRSEGAAEKKADREARFDTEHSNVQIVLNASKEQLEAAPAFVWLDQQADNARNERSVQ
jgi:putative membrane protein